MLALAKAAGHEIHAISFSYQQRHRIELTFAADQAAKQQVVAHHVIDLSSFAELVASCTSLIAGSELSVGKSGVDPEIIPSTYVPARNALFLSYALALAETVSASTIWIGVNALDYSGYPDCRPAFIDAFERMANLATKQAVLGDRLKIHAPLIGLHKHEIIRKGLALGVDYGQTLSCYDPEIDARGRALACGRCDSCRLRLEGFRLAGATDAASYVPHLKGATS